PTLPDGSRKELPQRDEKVYAPLSVAIAGKGGKRLIGAADYQGWQRWVRSSATRKDDNQGLRFLPMKPSVTIYDEAAKVVQRVKAGTFEMPAWYDLRLQLDSTKVYAWPHYWASRGLAGMSLLPADDDTKAYAFTASGRAEVLKRDFAPKLAQDTHTTVP